MIVADQAALVGHYARWADLDLDQTGLRGPLLFGGVTPGDKNDDPSIVDMKRDNALFNWATGMRRTIYNGPEQHQIWLRQQQEKARKEAEQ